MSEENAMMSQFDNPHAAGPQDPFDQTPKGAGSNPIGLVGFILSLTCILSPIGFLLSLFGLTKQPKGFAIAGTVIGLILTLVVGGVVGFGWWFSQQPYVQWQSEVSREYTLIQSAIEAEASAPDDLAALSLPSEATTDPWGAAYVYEVDDAGDWTLTTLGPDGEAGTRDDLTLKSGLEPFSLGFEFQPVQEAWMDASAAMSERGDLDSAADEAAEGVDDAEGGASGGEGRETGDGTE